MRMILLALLILLGGCVSGSEETVAMERVATTTNFWVDADPACQAGIVFADPDDCLAIIMLRHARVPVAGLSTGRGNTSSEAAYGAARLIAGTIPVYAGSEQCDSLFQRQFADVAGRNPVTILALGPLTNVASLLRCDPTLVSKIAEVVFVGGRREGQRFISNTQLPWSREIRDLNVEEDVEALTVVLRSGIPMRLVPFEAGNAVPLSVWGARFRNASLISTELQARAQQWSLLTSVAWGSGGLLPFDPVAVSAVLWPHLFHCRQVEAEVQLVQLVVVPTDRSTPVRYCLPIDPERVRHHTLTMLTQ